MQIDWFTQHYELATFIQDSKLSSNVEIEHVTTLFWTPCASPQNYYTPPPSPSRVVLGDSVENTMSFASKEIHSQKVVLSHEKSGENFTGL